VSPLISSTRAWRKMVRRLNWRGLFVDLDPADEPVAVLAGYTRSGTTFLGRLLSNIVTARPIHEPLNPSQVPSVSFFNERESRSTVENNPEYQQAIAEVLSPGFSGTRYTNTGSRIFYRGRIVKIVRANHYVDYISSIIPNTPFIVIMRNPYSCISSRIEAGWPVPNHSHSIEDIAPLLSDRQLTACREGGSVAARLATSWCLDNFMLLRNSGNSNFCFVKYENILANPEAELRRLLLHIKRERFVDRIPRELRVESDEKAGTQYLDKWKKILSADDVRDIAEILEIFHLDGHYDTEAGMPIQKPPFAELMKSK
jgi:hypothetical protein